MSKKRNKNERKKRVKARSKSRRDVPTVGGKDPSLKALEAQWESDFQAPEVQKSDSGVGSVGRMREFMTRREEGPEASLLHKRRSCLELLVWMAGAIGVAYVVIQQIRSWAAGL